MTCRLGFEGGQLWRLPEGVQTVEVTARGGEGSACAIDTDGRTRRQTVESSLGLTDRRGVVVMADRAGSSLGQFRLLQRIGSGAMGEVYVARDEEMGVPRAVKVLPAELSKDPGFVAHFRDEARVIAELDHPHIVQLHYMGCVEGMYFLVMDYVAGPEGSPLSLRGQLKAEDEDCPPERQVLTWAMQIAEALAYAHGRGVVHRHLRPENILLDAEGNAKLTNFGLAKAAGNEFILSQVPTIPARAGWHWSADASDILGTYDYMAPEQRGEFAGTIDERTDVYAFGVLLYTMLTGRRPVGRWEAASQVAGVRPGWDDLIDRCLEYEPADRYPSAELLVRVFVSWRPPWRLARPRAWC